MPIGFECDVMVELVDVAVVVGVKVAAMTHGDASTAAMAIAATAVSCAVLVFILSSVSRNCASYLLDFRDYSRIATCSSQEAPMIGLQRSSQDFDVDLPVLLLSSIREGLRGATFG